MRSGACARLKSGSANRKRRNRTDFMTMAYARQRPIIKEPWCARGRLKTDTDRNEPFADHFPLTIFEHPTFGGQVQSPNVRTARSGVRMRRARCRMLQWRSPSPLSAGSSGLASAEEFLGSKPAASPACLVSPPGHPGCNCHTATRRGFFPPQQSLLTLNLLPAKRRRRCPTAYSRKSVKMHV